MPLRGMILGIQSHVSNGIIKVTIRINISCGNAIPPTKEIPNATLISGINQLTLLILKYLHRPPFMGH